VQQASVDNEVVVLIPFVVASATRLLFTDQNKADFVSLTECRSCLRFAVSEQGERNMSNASSTDNAIPSANIVRRAARIGAEIRDVRLSGDLSDEVVLAINKVLLEHKVIFFRDQGHLDDAEQERFAVRLGKLVPHPTIGATKGTSSILELDSGRGGGRADQWHTDVTFVDAYPKISVLRGVVIPPYGGDTVWSNMAAAYLDLPAPLRKLADELWALHSNAYD
jgi:taurine dioxygenase